MIDTAALQLRDKAHLLDEFSGLVNEDRHNTATLVAYIAEIDRRKLYLEYAYPSMFAFCTRRFHMSEAIAHRRIRAGRTTSRFPSVLGMLARGEMHLTGVHQLASHLTEENHLEVLARAKHMSTREIENLVAELAPKPDVPSSIRSLPRRRASMPLPEVEASGTPASPASGAGTSDASKPKNEPKARPVPLSPRRYKLQVTIGQETRDKLDELQGLLSHRIPDGDPAKILDRALDALLKEAKKKKAALTDKPRQSSKKTKKKNRGIPARVRREVFERDEGRCVFVDARGRRCAAALTTNMKPTWRTGSCSWKRSGAGLRGALPRPDTLPNGHAALARSSLLWFDETWSKFVVIHAATSWRSKETCSIDSRCGVVPSTERCGTYWSTAARHTVQWAAPTRRRFARVGSTTQLSFVVGSERALPQVLRRVLPAAPSERLAERFEAEGDVSRGGRRAHQPDAPGFAFEIAEPTSDLEVVVTKELRSNLGVVHSLGNPDEREGREAHRGVDGELQTELSQAAIKGLSLLPVPRVAAFQPFVEREPERSMKGEDHVDGGSVMVDPLAAEVLPEQAEIQVPASHRRLSLHHNFSRPIRERNR